MENIKRVSGSVIQRSIVLKDISTILNLASVPSSDIGYKKSLKMSVAQLIGVYTFDCLTDFEYNKALQIVIDPKFWRDLEDFYHEFYGPPFDMFLHKWSYYFRRWHKEYFGECQEKEIKLSDDILFCQLGGVNIDNVSIPWFTYPLPFSYFPPKRDFEYITDKFLRKFEIKPEHFSISLKIRTSALLTPNRIRLSLEEIYGYHIPFGKSPESESETLRNIIKHAKSIVVAPLVAGAMDSATLLSTGQYILAVECSLASGVSMIILVASKSIADRVLKHLSRRREEEGRENE